MFTYTKSFNAGKWGAAIELPVPHVEVMAGTDKVAEADESTFTSATTASADEWEEEEESSTTPSSHSDFVCEHCNSYLGSDGMLGRSPFLQAPNEPPLLTGRECWG